MDSSRGVSSGAEMVERGLKHLRQYVKSRGLRNSSTRELVARAALETEGHFEANDLLHGLREQGISGVHLTTIYRTLPLLAEAKLIAPTLRSSGERQFFERAFERSAHDHIICTQCGKVIEFEFEAFQALQRDIAARYGFKLEGHIHELLGTCGACAKAKDPG